VRILGGAGGTEARTAVAATSERVLPLPVLRERVGVRVFLI
jgi:hypothetical protein